MPQDSNPPAPALVDEFLLWYADPARTLDEAFSAEILIRSALRARDAERGLPATTYDADLRFHRTRRDNPAHRAVFPAEELAEARPYLARLTRFLADAYEDRPVRSLEVLRFFPGLTTVQWRGQVADASPLQSLALEQLTVHDDRLLDLTVATQPVMKNCTLYLDQPWPRLRGLEVPERIDWFLLHTNLHALGGIPKIGAVGTASLKNRPGKTPLRDLRQLPALPLARCVEIDATDSLEGANFPAVRELNLTGTFRDLAPLAGLSELVLLKLHGEHFADLAPLASLPQLLQLELVRTTPLELTPLAECPALRVVAMEFCPALETEVEALQAALPSAEDDFLAAQPRLLPPWRLRCAPRPIAATPKMDAKALRTPAWYEHECFRLREIELCRSRLQARLDALLGRGWGAVRTLLVPGLMLLDIKRLQDVARLDEIVDALRRCSAEFHYPWHYQVWVEPDGEVGDFEEEEDSESRATRRRQRRRAETFELEREKADFEETQRRRREWRQRVEREHRHRLKLEQNLPVEPGEFAPAPAPEPEVPPQAPTVWPDTAFTFIVTERDAWVGDHQIAEAMLAFRRAPEPGDPAEAEPYPDLGTPRWAAETRRAESGVPRAESGVRKAADGDRKVENRGEPADAGGQKAEPGPRVVAAPPGGPERFDDWVRDPTRTSDELYAAELLVERALIRWAHAHGVNRPLDFEARERHAEERRENPAYRSTFSPEDLARTMEHLREVLEFDGGGWRERPVRSLAALRYFPALTACSSTGCHQDISPLLGLPLERLSLRDQGTLRDLAPLAALTKLRSLKLRLEAPWPDVSALTALPELEELEFEGNLFTLAPVAALPRARRVRLAGDPWNTALASCADVPELPAVRELFLGEVASLAGLRCPRVQNLVLVGDFVDLTPLAALTELTRLELRGSEFTDLTPLARLPRLRELVLTRALPLDLAPLAEVPALHEVDVPNCPMLRTELAGLQAGFLSWDTEFAAPTPRPLSHPWRFICSQDNFCEAAFAAVEGPWEEFLGDDAAFYKAHARWTARAIQRRLDALLGRGWGYMPDGLGHRFDRPIVNLKRFQDVMRAGEVIDALRAASAASRFPCMYWVVFEPHGDMSEELEEIAARHRDPDEPETFDPEAARQQWQAWQEEQRRREAQIEREHRYRLRVELGHPIDPAEFSPRPPVEPTSPGGIAQAEAREKGPLDLTRPDGRTDAKDDDDGDDNVYVESDGASLGEMLYVQVFVAEDTVWLPKNFREKGEYLLGRQAE